MTRSKPAAAHKASAVAPARQLAGFIAKFDPAVAKLTRAALQILRARFPTAVTLVYDNYAALAIGFGPNERASEAIISLAVYARGVNLYFIQGAILPDPLGLLQGSGSQGRYIRLHHAAQIKDAGIEALLRAAEREGDTPLPAKRRGYTVIKSISAKQRPRRPSSHV